MITPDTPIVMLTVGQLLELIDQRIASQPKPDPDPRGELVWGLSELAKFLGLSKSQACINLNAGRYGNAVIHEGRRVGFYPKLLKQQFTL